jgi:hypothetical protein
MILTARLFCLHLLKLRKNGFILERGRAYYMLVDSCNLDEFDKNTERDAYRHPSLR